MKAQHTDPRIKLERLQLELAARSSTTHFTHASISLVGALALGLGSFHPSPVGGALGPLSLALALYGSVRFLVGRHRLKWELERFEALKDLRRTLKLDDPSALLPQ
jgi:hypothetical protein